MSSANSLRACHTTLTCTPLHLTPSAETPPSLSEPAASELHFNLNTECWCAEECAGTGSAVTTCQELSFVFLETIKLVPGTWSSSRLGLCRRILCNLWKRRKSL